MNNKSAAYNFGVIVALKEAKVIKDDEVIKGTGKETRLRLDYMPHKFFNVRRHFERAGSHKKEIGKHVPQNT